MPDGKIAFVPPRYGDDVVGGSEQLSRDAAHGLAGRGWDVEVLTTQARNHYTWDNEYPGGTTTVDGVTVRRFPTVRTWASVEAERLERRVQMGERLTIEEQLAWVNGRFRVPDLFHHLVLHASEYRAIVFSPYLFWTTIVGTAAAPERTIVIPCLHDETYAHLDVVRPVMADVADVWFLSEPEHQLAHRLGPLAARHAVTGSGVEIPERYDADGARARLGLRNPFIYYGGRREGGKGWEWLLDAFAAAVARYRLPFDLVTTGVGPVHAPPSIADRVIDLGFLDRREIPNVFAAADAYVQPSRMESFSFTIMEAWLAGTPVIANGESDVVTWHCERSGAGLTYHDWFEFAECLRFLAEAPEAARKLAASGRDYVLEHYRWDAVLDAMEARLEEMPA